jgi:hypothetical protein
MLLDIILSVVGLRVCFRPDGGLLDLVWPNYFQR